ncbi:MAG: hypothetical protein UT78_C0024G0007 [Candidatus Nomurabacteria bacterium GW2011_GWF2_40_12]|uniref:Uncharacterized protein n=1 Tax=Candidatus Nomurabacteria bacterium GW2011_GWF2_40_12 TaxID=1618776 RepID=A0A0G0QVY9_9BACT|nr:MAG: hypothetical protein UT78_C0024G0007 [Candidatus Nomurabacteria bacterium GW2011_GWF2_40_12]
MNNDIFFFFNNLAHQSVTFDKVIVFTAETLPYVVITLAGLFLLFFLPAQAGRKSWRELFLVFASSGVAYFNSYQSSIRGIFQCPSSWFGYWLRLSFRARDFLYGFSYSYFFNTQKSRPACAGRLCLYNIRFTDWPGAYCRRSALPG